jgi:hypothetical protein
MFDHSYMQSPCSPLIEDYTQIFYTIDEGDISYFQCEMILRWSKSMREVDGQISIFIDFNVPALAPRLSWIQTVLQFSENIILFEISGINRSTIGKEDQVNIWCLGSMIYIHIVQCWGQDGTLRHACISFGIDISPSSETLNCLCETKELISLIILAENSNLNSLYSKHWCHRIFRYPGILQSQTYCWN